MKAFPSDNDQHAALLQEGKDQRARLFPGGAAPEPTEAEAEVDPEGSTDDDDNDGAVGDVGVVGEVGADMDEPDDEEQDYQAFFDSIMDL